MSFIRDEDDPLSVRTLVLALAACGALFLLGSVFGCASAPPLVSPPSVPTTRLVALTVSPAVVNGTLSADGGGVYNAHAADGRLVFTIPATLTGGAVLHLDADGYRHVDLRVALDPELLPAPYAMQPAVRAWRVVGRTFVTDDGQPVHWQGVTAFRLVQMVATGDELGADDYLAWAADHDVTIVRVLAMAGSLCDGKPCLFHLDPADGRAALPRLLELAEAHGLHVEVVALADTAFYTFDRRDHVAQIGATCAVHPSCLVELANEPVHPTQAAEVGDPVYLRSLAGLIPTTVLRALGPAGATIAEADPRFLDGSDYDPIHEERGDDGSGVRWVRHLADLREISAAVGKPVVSDEPQRTDMAADNHAGAGALARVFGLGDTFHYSGGLGASVPSGAELDAFEGRRAGWHAIPATWTGGHTYCNATFAGCPVANADWSTVVKVYGTVDGDAGYEVAVGAKGEPSIAWAPDWPSRELVLAMGRSWVWQVSR